MKQKKWQKIHLCAQKWPWNNPNFSIFLASKYFIFAFVFLQLHIDASNHRGVMTPQNTLADTHSPH